MGINIKKIRKSKKITQKELSNKTGLSISYLQQLEYGSKQNPTFEALNAIAKALDVTVNELADNEIDFNSEDIRLESLERNKSEKLIENAILNILERNNEDLDDRTLFEMTKETLKYVEFLIYKTMK